MASWARKSHQTPVEAASTSLVRISASIKLTSWRNETDFGAVAFEETILTILPSVTFILATCPRIFYLLRSKDQTSRQSTYTPKLVSAIKGSKTMLYFTNISVIDYLWSIHISTNRPIGRRVHGQLGQHKVHRRNCRR